MPYFQLKKRKVLFLHVPKCAGSSLTEMLLEHPDCRGHGLYRKGRESLDYAVTKCPPQHFHAAILQTILELERFDLVFTVVRDPLKRLLSEHAMCLLRGDVAACSFDLWYEEARRRRREDAFVWDNHLRPALDFMLPQALVYALDGGLPRIWADLGARLDITVDNVEVKHVRPRQSVATDEARVSDATRECIRQEYAADYDLHRFAWERHRAGLPVATVAEWQRGRASAQP